MLSDVDKRAAGKLIIEATAYPPKRNVFVIGPFGKRIGFAAQQCRALNLIWALKEHDLFKEGARVAVVGAGVAGLAACAGLLARRYDFELFERYPGEDGTCIGPQYSRPRQALVPVGYRPAHLRPPASDIKPTSIVGEKVARDRLLNDDEVFAFWRAAKRMPYPAGPVFKLLLLTGLRLGEVSDASWSEFNPVVIRAIRQRGEPPIDWSRFDQQQLTWTIPQSRMKGRNNKARAHVVPLTVDMLQILESLPVFVSGGDYLFSRNAGRKPAVMSTKIKDDLDARMLRTLRAMARQRDDDPATVELKPFVTHDLRRVVRSGLSRLKVAEEIREAVLAHARPGIKGVYDQHDYLDEKREALMLWGARLRGIVEPAPVASNVVALRG